MHERPRHERAARITIDAVPELPTRIGMAGAMRHAEVGGSACTGSGIVIAVSSAFIADR